MNASVQFAGLPGVQGGALTGIRASTRSGFIKALRLERVASGAGDYGAIMVWIDDAGAYRCALTRYLHMVAASTFKTKREVAVWLDEFLPQMHEAPK